MLHLRLLITLMHPTTEVQFLANSVSHKKGRLYARVSLPWEDEARKRRARGERRRKGGAVEPAAPVGDRRGEEARRIRGAAAAAKGRRGRDPETEAHGKDGEEGGEEEGYRRGPGADALGRDSGRSARFGSNGPGWVGPNPHTAGSRGLSPFQRCWTLSLSNS